MKTAHEALATAVTTNNADGISQAANTVGNLTAQMTAVEAKADAALYLILSPDQQAKFGQIESKHVFFAGGDGVFLRAPDRMMPVPPPIN
jgi:Spy/CpxP family protein refolding chaperone